jgi:hypothetical protein
MNTRTGTALALGLGLCWACREQQALPAPAGEAAAAAPDRLQDGEQLPDSETAFGLPLPKGMRLVRHFNDSAYFNGDTDLDAVLTHLRQHLAADGAQLVSRGAVFPRARIVGGDPQQLYRVEVTRTARGSQIHIKDITPAPAPELTGLSEAEIWRRAGRNPDGTPLDPNQVY